MFLRNKETYFLQQVVKATVNWGDFDSILHILNIISSPLNIKIIVFIAL